MTTLVGAAVTPRSGARDARSQDNAVAKPPFAHEHYRGVA